MVIIYLSRIVPGQLVVNASNEVIFHAQENLATEDSPPSARPRISRPYADQGGA